MFNERFIGTLSVYHTDAAFYRDDHRRLLDRVSEQAAAVINNSMLFEQTQEDSLTDPLTGLPNTRFLFMHLTRELARAERLKAEVSLMVMDLDNFKEINDNHGHHVGDRALVRGRARAARRDPPLRHLRPLRGRRIHRRAVGLRRGRSGAQAAGAAEGIDDVYFEARPGKRLQLGISVGAAVFPQDGESYEALLATADSRMYQDKSGRKRRTGRDESRAPPEHARRQHRLSRAQRPRHPARGRGNSLVCSSFSSQLRQLPRAASPARSDRLASLAMLARAEPRQLPVFCANSLARNAEASQRGRARRSPSTAGRR